MPATTKLGIRVETSEDAELELPRLEPLWPVELACVVAISASASKRGRD